MHFDTPPASPADDKNGPWYKDLTRYHWFVLVVSALGWLFDCLDQQLFTLARVPAIRELRGPEDLKFYGGLATTIFIFGWATGGIIFGIMGDKVGRARTMVITILAYSLFTGLSSLSVGYWDFVFYRFLTGLGVGGEFAVGVALVAEVMPDRARPHALGWLQALSAVGNISAAFIGMGLAPLEAAGLLGQWQPWRWMFVIGALPALLALLIRRRLKEPERWKQMHAAQASGGVRLGSVRELFAHPTWRRNAIVGLLLATSGVVGLWGIGFFSPDLVRSVFKQQFETEARTAEAVSQEREFVRLVIQGPERAERLKDTPEEAGAKPRLELVAARVQPEHLLDTDSKALYETALELHKSKESVSPDSVLAKLKAKDASVDEGKLRRTILKESPGTAESVAPLIVQIATRTQEIASRSTWWTGINQLFFNIGAFFGIYAFSKITHYTGRKPAFAVTFLLALISTAYTFYNLNQLSDIFWMVPIMGFCQIALFGGYAIYFPELFPTRLRSTGTSFCYNVGRYVSAPGSLFLGILADRVFGQYGDVMSFRYAGVTMCAFFLIGLVALPFAPETKGKPLPE